MFRMGTDAWVVVVRTLLVYLGVFFFAFGTRANVGILARQRSQAMPFVFVLLCLPPVEAKLKEDKKPALRSPTNR